jgi:hypothetical protein
VINRDYETKYELYQCSRFSGNAKSKFCWFITQGLNEDWFLFSRIHDFSQNTEYLMFGEEYSLIKPPYSINCAKI